MKELLLMQEKLKQNKNNFKNDNNEQSKIPIKACDIKSQQAKK
jgi:hypothetical protein